MAMLCCTAAWAKEDKEAKELDRVQASGTVLNEIMSAPDNGIPEEILAKAECVAVIPSMMKGGFIVGGRYGKGVATCRTGGNGWSAPAPIRIEGGSYGLQIGGQEVDLVMLIMNQDGMQNLLSSKFRIGADASAAAGPVGRHAEGATDWKMRAQVLTYSRARGAFAGVTLNGAVLKQDDDDTRELYGRDVPFRDILSGKVPPPAGTQQFIATVSRVAGMASADERHENAADRRDRDYRGNDNYSSRTSSGSAGASAPMQNDTSGAMGSNANSGTSMSGTDAGLSNADVQTNIMSALKNQPYSNNVVV
ncbi:MAG: lipid-binding SYLF domain-containing protein, partial [Acidobacteriaceae bacterium]|nr:lipid-binding SYLF domain-containing protein [Acidobacteriaceae bacterium]